MAQTWAWVSSLNNVTASGTGTTLAKAYSPNNTAGNFLSAWGTWGTGTSGATFADTANGTWSATVKTTNDAGNGQSISSCFFANCAAGANTVTMTTPSSDHRGLIIREASGIVTVSPEDGTAAGSTQTAGTSHTTNTVTVSQADDMVVGFIIEDSAGSATITSSSTIHSGDGPAIVNNVDIACADKNGPASGTTSVAFTFSTSQTAILQCRCFKQAAAAGRTTKNTRAFPLGMEIGMNWQGTGSS